MMHRNSLSILTCAAFISLVMLISKSYQISGFSIPAIVRPNIHTLAQNSAADTQEPLILTDQQVEYSLGLHLEILEDPGGDLTIKDVTSPEFEAQFTPSKVEVPNYGFTSNAYWVRFRLINGSQQNTVWLLEMGFANMQYIDLYSPLPGSEGFAAKQTGALRQVSSRDVLNPNFVFRLSLPHQSEETFYMRFQSGTSMTLPLTLWTQEAFSNHSQQLQMLYWLFFGAIFALLVYHLFLLFILRDTSYLFFVILLTSLLVTEMSYSSYLETYLFPGLNYLRSLYYPWSFSIVIASIILFSDAFLEIKSRLPKLHLVNIAFVAVWGGLIVLTPFISFHNVAILSVTWAVVSLITTFVAGILTWKQGYHPTRFFMIAWFGLLAGFILLLLVRLGIAPSTFFSENLILFAILWMAVCWSIALADRINLLKSEKEMANLEVQAGESRYRQLVETMNDGLGVIDQNGRYTYVNHRLAEMIGCTPEEMVGHLMGEFVIPEDKQTVIDQLAKRKTGVNAPYELTWHRKDGPDVVTMVSPRPIFAANDQFLGSFAVVTDITERVEASRLLEKRVAERTHQLSTLLEISHEINTTQALDNILRRILEQLKSIVDYRHSAILIFEEANWNIGASWPANLAEKIELQLTSEERHILLQELAPGKPILLNHLVDNDALTNVFQPLSDQLSQVFHIDECNWLGIPLSGKDHLIGLFILGCEDQNDLSEDPVKVALAFGNQAAIVIENHQLLDQVQAAAAAEERNFLAQDLHDSVTQTLFTASVLAEVTPRIWDRDQGIARKNMEMLNTLIRGALAEMRSLLFELRSAGLRNQTLEQLLITITEAGRARTRAAINLSINTDFPLPENVAIAFYRIAQEALNPN
jgi:PAS domain S-box-containing protein